MSSVELLRLDPEPANPAPGREWRWDVMAEAKQSAATVVTLVWRWIPPGNFRMGARGYYPDEEPIHKVTVSRGSWMLETPVTQAQWLAVMGGENPSFHQQQKGWEQHPVERVTWPMAGAWCGAVESRLPERLRGVWQPSLPTEAQWEYACRAGTESEYFSGSGEERLDEAGWYVGNSGGRTHPVRQKRPNAWVLLDVHGNVWEWCRDPWQMDAYSHREDGCDAESCAAGDENSPRVMRGGDYAGPAVDCRSACRDGRQPGHDDDGLGFRACLLPGPVFPRASKVSARSTL